MEMKPCSGRLNWKVVEEFGASKDDHYESYPIVLWTVTDLEQPGVAVEIKMPHDVMLRALIDLLENEKYIDYMRGRGFGDKGNGRKQELYYYGNHVICAIRRLYAKPIDPENIPEVYRLSHIPRYDGKPGTYVFTRIRRIFAWMFKSRATPDWEDARRKEDEKYGFTRDQME